ncbi:MAG: tripartite tricarboxylate transporter substrate binding protein [Betaproteobacteria bacterium]|nr:tripartite tricarboxylate transporter substrate binding protein [Betaproteobacteria bacterium]
MKTVLSLAAALLVSVAAPQAPAAEKYPTRPVRLIVPFAPGGGTDIMSRILAGPVSASLGQTVVVDNRPGAGGALGAELAAKAEPDGHTLVMVSSSYAASAAYRKLPYDPVNGIQPVVLIGTTGLVMVVHPSVPAKSVRGLIDHAKANPGKLNYATVGTGSVTHLAHEQLRLLTGINIVHIPYKGGGPALAAVVAGEAQLTMISMVPTLPHVKAGRLRPLGVTTPKPMRAMPELPRIGDTVPGFEVIHWYGIWGPKGMPKDVVARWNREVAKVLFTDEMKTRTSREGLEAGGGPPEELHKLIRRDVEKWRRVVKEGNIR